MGCGFEVVVLTGRPAVRRSCPELPFPPVSFWKEQDHLLAFSKREECGFRHQTGYDQQFR
jgi:hypothetical protein